MLSYGDLHGFAYIRNHQKIQTPYRFPSCSRFPMEQTTRSSSANPSYPLVNVYIAIENGPVDIIDLPIEKWWIFP